MKEHFLNIIEIWKNKIPYTYTGYDKAVCYCYRSESLSLKHIYGTCFYTLTELIAAYNKIHNTNINIQEIEKLLVLL